MAAADAEQRSQPGQPPAAAPPHQVRRRRLRQEDGGDAGPDSDGGSAGGSSDAATHTDGSGRGLSGRNGGGGGRSGRTGGGRKRPAALVAVPTANVWDKTQLLLASLEGNSDSVELLVRLPSVSEPPMPESPRGGSKLAVAAMPCRVGCKSAGRL